MANPKEASCQCRRHKRHRFSLWVGKIPWRRAWQPIPVLLLGKFHGQRSLAGYSPWDPKECDMIEWMSTHTHTHTHTQWKYKVPLTSQHNTVVLLLQIIKLLSVLNYSSITIIPRKCLRTWVWIYHYRYLNNLLIIWWNSSGSLPSSWWLLFYKKGHIEKPISLPGSINVLKLVFKRGKCLLWFFKFH